MAACSWVHIHTHTHTLCFSDTLSACPSLPSLICPLQCQEEARTQLREFEECKRQIEEDGDHEIQEIRVCYERLLRDEKDTNLKIMGDTGIMKKKVLPEVKEERVPVNYIEDKTSLIIPVPLALLAEESHKPWRTPWQIYAHYVFIAETDIGKNHKPSLPNLL